MDSGDFYRKISSQVGKQEVYLRIRSVEGDNAVCDEFVLAEHEEDDRVFHNLFIPISLLQTGYKYVDENNPLIDVLFPLHYVRQV